MSIVSAIAPTARNADRSSSTSPSNAAIRWRCSFDIPTSDGTSLPHDLRVRYSPTIIPGPSDSEALSVTDHSLKSHPQSQVDPTRKGDLR